jgi:hypothetical protein
MSPTDAITDSQATQMLQHWLSTPRFSRLGQDYGNRIAEWLQRPLHADAVADANAAVRDLQTDIPMFGAMPIDVYVQVLRPDKRFVVFDFGGGRVASDGLSATIESAA